MKKVFLAICLTCCVMMVQGQLKVSLSYQMENQKDQTTESGIISESISSEYSGTVQATALWQFTPNFSAYAGVGYNSQKMSIKQTIDFTNTRDPLFCGVGYPYENIETNQLENIEIPLGIRLNTASYKKFELGFSLGIVGIISNTVIDEYDGVNSFNYFNGIVSCLAEDNISYNAANNVNTQWRNSSYRMDMGLDIQYNLSTAWQIQLAGTWGAFDWKKRVNFWVLDLLQVKNIIIWDNTDSKKAR